MNVQEKGVIDLEEYRELRKASGGNGPPKAPGGNWLAELEQGTRFLARSIIVGGSEVQEFFISSQMQNVAMLAHNIRGMQVSIEWHDTAIFSKENKLYLVLEVIHDHQQIQPRGLAGNESPKDLD